MQQQGDNLQSEFNNAFGWLNRINIIQYQINDAKQRKDISEWCDQLIILFAEVSTAIKAEEVDNKLIELQRIMNEVDHHTRTAKRGSIDRALYWKLTTLEIWIRRQMDKAGLITRKKDDAMHALK